MERKLPTILILVVMALVGVMYWVDLAYYTDPATGFVQLGPLWVRYLVLLLPLLMGLLGLRTVGARSIATLRMKSPVLCALFAIAGLAGLGYGGVVLYKGVQPFALWQALLGALFLWYGAWMLLAARQMAVQDRVAPTRSAVPGVLAALPFCALTIWRVMVKPTTLHRIGPFVRNFAALFAMLWFGVLLRGLYIALVRGRVKWMYGLGIFTFLLAACLELPLALYTALNGQFDLAELLEGVVMGSFGLVAGAVSVAIAGQSMPGAKAVRREANGKQV